MAAASAASADLYGLGSSLRSLCCIGCRRPPPPLPSRLRLLVPHPKERSSNPIQCPCPRRQLASIDHTHPVVVLRDYVTGSSRPPHTIRHAPGRTCHLYSHCSAAAGWYLQLQCKPDQPPVAVPSTIIYLIDLSVKKKKARGRRLNSLVAFELDDDDGAWCSLDVLLCVKLQCRTRKQPAVRTWLWAVPVCVVARCMRRRRNRMHACSAGTRDKGADRVRSTPPSPSRVVVVVVLSACLVPSTTRVRNRMQLAGARGHAAASVLG